MTPFKKVLFWLCITLGLFHLVRFTYYKEDLLTAFLGFISMSLTSMGLYYSKDKK